MANTAIPFHQQTGVSLTPNWAKRLVLNNAPAAMEFGVSIGAGTDPVVFTGDATAEQLRETLESCTDLTGHPIDVYGGTQVSGTGPDGVPLHSGAFIVLLNGTLPYPEWGSVQNSEVQGFAVEGDNPYTEIFNYTLNGSDEFNLDISAGSLQSAQRLLGGDYADVIVHGDGSATGIGADVTYPGQFEGGQGIITDNDSETAIAWGNAIENYTDFDLAVPTTLVGMTLVISPFAPGYEGPSELRLYGKNEPFAGGGAGGGELVQAFTNLAPWDLPHEHSGLLLFDAPVTYRYYRYYATAASSSVTFNTHEIELLGAGNPAAHFRSYFPFSTGNVATPTATGPAAVVSTIHQHGSVSELAVIQDVDFEALLLAGLQNSANPSAPSFAPNDSHWLNPDPATTGEAVNRLAAMLYNYMGEPIY